MYTLTLTKDERKAIDWIGNRYWNGADLRDLLEDGEVIANGEWDDENEVRYAIPENIAWDMMSLWQDSDGSIPCFGPELTIKLVSFFESIV